MTVSAFKTSLGSKTGKIRSRMYLWCMFIFGVIARLTFANTFLPMLKKPKQTYPKKSQTQDKPFQKASAAML